MGSRTDGDFERPRAVSEYLLERMQIAGADKICFVVAPGKSDIVHYYGSHSGHSCIFYVDISPIDPDFIARMDGGAAAWNSRISAPAEVFRPPWGNSPAPFFG